LPKTLTYTEFLNLLAEDEFQDEGARQFVSHQGTEHTEFFAGEDMSEGCRWIRHKGAE
jgi:hypothetical protein